MNICSDFCNNDIFSVVLWGMVILLLLLIGSFIRISTWGNFNCSFSQWSSNVSFDGLNLLVIFVVFEIEVVVVIIMVSSIILVWLLLVTIVELVLLYQ